MAVDCEWKDLSAVWGVREPDRVERPAEEVVVGVLECEEISPCDEDDMRDDWGFNWGVAERLGGNG